MEWLDTLLTFTSTLVSIAVGGLVGFLYFKVSKTYIFGGIFGSIVIGVIGGALGSLLLGKISLMVITWLLTNSLDINFIAVILGAWFFLWLFSKISSTK